VVVDFPPLGLLSLGTVERFSRFFPPPLTPLTPPRPLSVFRVEWTELPLATLVQPRPGSFSNFQLLFRSCVPRKEPDDRGTVLCYSLFLAPSRLREETGSLPDMYLWGSVCAGRCLRVNRSTSAGFFVACTPTVKPPGFAADPIFKTNSTGSVF